MATTEDLIKSIVSGDISDLQPRFDQLVKDKVVGLIDRRREELGAQLSSEEE